MSISQGLAGRGVHSMLREGVVDCCKMNGVWGRIRVSIVHHRLPGFHSYHSNEKSTQIHRIISTE